MKVTFHSFELYYYPKSLPICSTQFSLVMINIVCKDFRSSRYTSDNLVLMSHIRFWTNQIAQSFSSVFDFYWSGLLCDLLWADPDKDLKRWDENSAGISHGFGVDIVNEVSHWTIFCGSFIVFHYSFWISTIWNWSFDRIK